MSEYDYDSDREELGISFGSERVPPQHLPSERGVLGAVIRDNSALHDVMPILQPEDFFRDSHRIIFRAMRDLYAERGGGIDGIILSDELARRGEFDRIGDDELIDITESVPHAGFAKMHAQIVRQKSIVRSLISAANDVIEKGYAGTGTAEQVMEFANQRMTAVMDRAAHQSTASGSAASCVAEALEWLENRQATGNKLCGLSTGLADLDAITMGLEPGELVILAARPSLGKSGLAMGICEHQAIEHGKHILFVSLEMSRLQLTLRLLSLRSKIPLKVLRAGVNLGQNQAAALGKAAEDFARSNLTILDADIHTFTQIGAVARQAARRGKLDLLVVDYLQLMEGGDGKKDNRNTEVGKYTRGLKRLATQLGIPVMALSQLNRGPEGGKEGARRPRMGDIRDSGCVEQDADKILLLHRPDPMDSTIVTVIVEKNRNGETGDITLGFEKAYVRFHDHTPPAANVATTAAY